MKTIREFLEEQINEQLIQAVVSGRRTGEGPSKVKLRPEGSDFLPGVHDRRDEGLS